MTSLLLTGIAELTTHDPAHGPDPLPDGALVVESGRIAWTGPARTAPAADTSYDVGGRAVIPGFVDSHSHLVFAGDRAQEFAARMTGTPYSAGGIRTTVAATRAATDEQLTANVARLVDEMRRQGTTTVEIKSGYGLSVRDEARSLVVARQFTDETTFLGAHVVPEGTTPEEYVELVTGPMLEACAPHARWVDVFCERGAFDVDQARAVLAAGAAAGRPARVRAGWRASSASPLSTTARTSTTPTSPPSPTRARWRRCSRASSSPPVRRTRTPAASSTPASAWRSPATATRAPATPPRCRCASPSPCAR